MDSGGAHERDETRSENRRLSIVVGAFIVLAGAFIAWRGSINKEARARAAMEAAVSDAAVTAAQNQLAADAAVNVQTVAIDAGATALRIPEGAPGTRLPDGTPVPELPEKTPKTVRFGIVLVAYQGAQGAASNTRSKKEAFEMAQKLAADAKTDFKAAVVRGDSGSIEDVGRVPKGVLEPAPEYVLFTMPAGSVSEPIDTPKGFWIVKRLE